MSQRFEKGELFELKERDFYPPSYKNRYDALATFYKKSIPGVCACCPCRQPRKINITQQDLLFLLGWVENPPFSEYENLCLKRARSKHGQIYETGYFKKRTRSLKNENMTMAKLRMASPLVRHLQTGSGTIIESKKNISITKKKKRNVELKNNDEIMDQVNCMIEARMGGTILFSARPPDDSGEALLYCKETGKDLSNIILSQLVNGVDTSRMSSQDVTRIVHNSNVSFTSVDLNKARNSLHEEDSSEILENIEEKKEGDFINSLPQVSSSVKEELENDWKFTYNYVKTLESFIKKQESQSKTMLPKSAERWMVLFYTTSGNVDSFTHFRCLLVRLLLQHHCIVYEERDVALHSMIPLVDGENEQLYRVPMVFADGISIGGCKVIYAINKMKLMKQIFGKYIMKPDMYIQWLYSSERKEKNLELNVSLTSYPTLHSVALGQNVILTPKQAKEVALGKNIIKRARKQWMLMTKQNFTEPNLFRFVLLRNTIALCFAKMDELYFKAQDCTSESKQITET